MLGAFNTKERIKVCGRQHRASVQRFETYYMKNSISYGGSIVWNLLEPSENLPLSAPGNMLKGQKRSHDLRNVNLNEESPQTGSPQVVSDFVFYEFYS